MKKTDEFYVSYIDGSLGVETKKTLKRFVMASFALVILAALLFSFTQKTFKNSSFDFSSDTKIVGVYHEKPYPMLRLEVANHTYKNIMLLGFGKLGAHTALNKLKSQNADLTGKTLSIEGNLIYYNGKTLLQITGDEKVNITGDGTKEIPSAILVGEMTLEGEIIDPKCYFGVMKPGYGKIHRSCAALCISGGMPPVLATSDGNNIAEYYLLTDLEGNAIHKDILPFIGKPSAITGIVEKMEDWYRLKIDVNKIEPMNIPSSIY